MVYQDQYNEGPGLVLRMPEANNASLITLVLVHFGKRVLFHEKVLSYGYFGVLGLRLAMAMTGLGLRLAKACN